MTWTVNTGHGNGLARTHVVDWTHGDPFYSHFYEQIRLNEWRGYRMFSLLNRTVVNYVHITQEELGLSIWARTILRHIHRVFIYFSVPHLGLIVFLGRTQPQIAGFGAAGSKEPFLIIYVHVVFVSDQVSFTNNIWLWSTKDDTCPVSTIRKNILISIHQGISCITQVTLLLAARTK